MKVLLDLRRLGHGGIGRYSELLLSALQRLKDEEEADLELLVFLRSDSVSQVRIRFGIGDEQIHISKIPPNSAAEYLKLGGEINRINPDIYHTLNTPLPIGIKAKKVICTQDTIHLNYPRFFFYPPLFRFFIRDAISRADVAYSLSDFTRREILQVSRQANDKLVVVPPGIPSSWYTNRPKRIRNDLYLLAVISNNKRHKGLIDLLLSYRNIPQSVKGGTKLLIVGNDLKIESNRHTIPLFSQSDVEFLGHVSDAELRALICNAAALVVPSLMEGFCLPALEAKLLGTRLVARPVGVLADLVSSEDLLAKDFELSTLEDIISQALLHYKLPSLNHQHLLRRRYDQLLMARRIYSLYRSISGESGSARTTYQQRAKQTAVMSGGAGL